MSARKIYYWFSSLLGLGLGATATVYAPFLRSIGLSLAEIALVNTIFWIVVISAELPTGMLADGRSRAWSLRMGMFFQGLGGLVYVFASGFWSAAFAEASIGIGIAFLSGAQQAWIADALTREGKLEELRHVYANEMLLRTSFNIAGGFLGVTLALLSYRLIFVPIIFTSILAIVLCRRYMNGQGEPLERMTEWQALRTSWSHLRQSVALKWVIATMILFGCVVSFNHYWSLFFEDRVGTFGLSWVYAVLYMSFIPAGWFVRRTSIGAGHEGSMIILALLLTGVGLVLIPWTESLFSGLSAVMLHEFGRGMIQPLTDSFVQHRVQSAYRATFGSLQSFLGRAGFAIVPFIVWLGIDGEPNTSTTIQFVWLVCGCTIVLGACALYLLRPRRD